MSGEVFNVALPLAIGESRWLLGDPRSVSARTLAMRINIFYANRNRRTNTEVRIYLVRTQLPYRQCAVSDVQLHPVVSDA